MIATESAGMNCLTILLVFGVFGAIAWFSFYIYTKYLEKPQAKKKRESIYDGYENFFYFRRESDTPYQRL